MSFSAVARIEKRRICTESLYGRRCKCAPWVRALEASLTTEFDRLRKLRLNFFVNTLMIVSNNMLRDSTDDDYHKVLRYKKCDELIVDLFNTD